MPITQPKISKYLDPATLSRIGRLELGARMVVEGFMAGMHRSPYHGFSVEFAQHREYTYGDDTRHIDWKIYGKSGRYYIKQYEVETNFIAHILHDASESMLYASREMTKLEYANYLTASLSYLITAQQDAVGVGIFNEGLQKLIEPRQAPAHVHTICSELEQVRPQKKTDIGRIMHEFADRIARRGIVIVISDFLDDPARIMAGLNHLRFSRHEVIVMHVLDPYELDFPFDGLIKFKGLEEYPEITCQPRMLRRSYLEELNKHILALKVACERNLCDYVLVSTAQPLDVALFGYLTSRALRRRRGRVRA